jgi:type II secretory pathway component GspD/PulD (secretin)
MDTMVLLVCIGLFSLPVLNSAACWAQEEGPATEAPAKEPAPAPQEPQPPEEAAKGPRGYPLVSNVFYDTDIRQALSDIGEQAGATIIPDESVTGSITLDLREVPLERALELVLMPGGFIHSEVEEGVYLVTSPDPTAPGFARIARTQVVDLEYVSSEELERLLPDIYTGFVKYDEIGNRVVVTAPPQLLEATLLQIHSLDTPPLQIMIEALVVESTRNALRDFEVNLQGRHVGMGTGTGLITYVDEAERLLHALLWLAEHDQAIVRANPRVVAQEGQEANVKVATQQYFQILTGRVGWEYVRLEPIEAAIDLTITPHVAQQENKVVCNIKPEVGDVTGTGPNNLPIITKRSVETTVRIADGQVIAIAGLLQEIKREIQHKIPVLGDLPLVGPLFRSTSRRSQQREIVIFIIPHILDEAGHFEGPLLFQRELEGQLDPPAGRGREPTRQRLESTAAG